MLAILFQVIADTDPSPVQGFPQWLFWLLVVIIVLLLTFILIRDRGVRGKIKKFFSWIIKKIRVARIKTKINKKKQKKQNLLIRLGREVWEKKIEVPGTELELSNIQKLEADEIKIKNEIQKIDTDIEQNNLAIEELTKDKDQEVSGIMEKKNPLDDDYKTYLNERDLQERDIKEKDRLRIKTAKSITQRMEDINRTENDEYLSKIEKGLRRKELEQRITDLKNEEANISSALTSSREKLDNLKKKNDTLEQQISRHQEELNRINKDHKNQLQKFEEKIGDLRKHKNALNIKNVGLQKQLSLAFETLGDIVNKRRIDSSDLLGIYTQLDSINKSLKDLEAHLK